MPFVAVTFAVVFLIVVGLYWALVVRHEDVSRYTLGARLKTARAGVSAKLDVIKMEGGVTHIAFLDPLIARQQRLAAPVRQLLDEADVKMTPGMFALMSLGVGMAIYALVWYWTGLWYVGLGLGLLAAFIPYLAIKRKRQVRIRALEEQFPEAIDLIARALRAGHAFTTGLALVAEEVTAPLGPEFQLLFDRQNYGMPLPDALREFARRIPLIDVRFFVTAVLTQREAGGNLAEVLDNLATVIRERFKVKRQIRVVTAHGRITGWILAALPPILALVFFTMSPEIWKLLITDPLGVRMVVIAIALQIIGTIAIKKIIDVEY